MASDRIQDMTRVAVIGSGAAGLAASWALSARFDVTLFEAESRLGGHAHTVMVPAAKDGEGFPVDTGFIVFNRLNYPRFTAALAQLGVDSHESDMSFSVSWKQGALEYAGGVWGGLLAQPGNLFRGAYWRMLADLRRFYRNAVRDLPELESGTESLAAYLDAAGYSSIFRDWHLYPMAAAIWSQPMQEIGAMPAATLIRFFKAHGLFLFTGRPRWRTVSGGSRRYVERIAAAVSGRVVTATPILKVERRRPGIVLTDEAGGRHDFDAVVIAAHADQALAMLADPDPEEKAVLGAFSYRPNLGILHEDPALMPRRRRAWASWNFMAPEGGDGPQGVTYWMNRLQALPTSRQVFLSLNPPFEPRADRILGRFHYSHPVFDAGAIAAQPRLSGIQGRSGVWYCGSYAGYGFHEDAFASGLEAARLLGASCSRGSGDASGGAGS